MGAIWSVKVRKIWRHLATFPCINSQRDNTHSSLHILHRRRATFPVAASFVSEKNLASFSTHDEHKPTNFAKISSKITLTPEPTFFPKFANFSRACPDFWKFALQTEKSIKFPRNYSDLEKSKKVYHELKHFLANFFFHSCNIVVGVCWVWKVFGTQR